MLFVGGRNYLRREKEKRAEQEAQAQIIRETQPAKEKKTMSIADRARLAEVLWMMPKRQKHRPIQKKKNKNIDRGYL